MRWLVRQVGQLFDSPRATSAVRLGLASAALTAIAMLLVKLASIQMVAASEIGRIQLDGELSVFNALRWFAADLWAALLWGLLMGLAFGLAARRPTRIAAGLLLFATNAILAVALIAGLVVYKLFGTPPTLQLLESLDKASDASASVNALVSNQLLGFGVGLALLVAVLPLVLSKMMRRWPRLAIAVAVFLGLGSAAATVGEVAGEPSRFELDRNAVTSFASSAVFGVGTGDEVGYVPPSKFHEVLQPIAPPGRYRVDRDAYDKLEELGKSQPNVVLVLMESMSPYQMSVTNPERDTTPFLAELAKKSLFWPHHYSHTPKSIFAIYEVLCSTITYLHGDHPTKTRPRIDCRSLSELLTQNGYNSGLFHSGHFRFTHKDLFFAGRGWKVMQDAHALPHHQDYYNWSWGIEEAAAIDAMVDWADKNRDQPFFITYIPVYPHHPYNTPYPVEAPRDEKGPRAERKYHEALRYVDSMMAKMMHDFEARGLDKHTLFIFTGDHGEGFGEHPGSWAHGGKIYDEQTRTFALWYSPGLFDHQEIDDRTFGHIDLAPTLLDILGIPKEPRHRGQSALDPRRRPMVPLYTTHGILYTGFVDGRMKYIYNGRAHRSELYDLATDPMETTNVASQFPDTVARYRTRAHRLKAVAQEWWSSLPDLPDPPAIDPATLPGKEREWAMKPVDCEHKETDFFVESGVLRPHKSARAFCHSEELPAGDLVVTDFRVIGREGINASVIMALLAWVNDDGQRQQIAYCKLNGTDGNVATTCKPTMLVGRQRIRGGKGHFLSVLRYRTMSKDPPPEQFSVSEVRARYKVLE